MYFEYEELVKSINNSDARIKNYFDTFGFVVIRGILSKDDFRELLKEYDNQYELRTNEPAPFKMLLNSLWLSGKKRFGIKYSIRKIINRGAMRFLPNFVDGSEKYTEYFFSERFKQVYEYFAGKNWLYLGSDGSNFITTSFPWHRDWFTKIQILKCNFYYNPLPFIGGKFLIIPGSNFATDTYTQLIQKCMSWPMQNRMPGGLSENGRLHQVENPRDIFRLKNKSNQIAIPAIEVKIRKGDVVIFDQRAIHCVQNNFPKFQRRLMTILLSKNAFDFQNSHPDLNRHTRDELMQEVVDLIVNERNHIGCPPYGDALLKTNFSESNHFVNISKSIYSERFDTGLFKTDDGVNHKYQIDFNKYDEIGKEYREYYDSLNNDIAAVQGANSQDFSYADVHLGINAQNIKRFDYS